jgi:hypothetical protein
MIHPERLGSPVDHKRNIGFRLLGGVGAGQEMVAGAWRSTHVHLPAFTRSDRPVMTASQGQP